MRLTSDQLSIYLHDHLAGATVGKELARRARRANDGTPYGEFLADLERQIGEDRISLLKIMRRLDTGRDELKEALGWTGEKLGRLKFNGRLTGYAPLSRVVEFEALTAGVHAKLSMWRSLRDLAPHHQRLDVDELDELIRRGEQQLDGLEEHRRRAAAEAFGGRPSAAG
jgi:hypothetical protein